MNKVQLGSVLKADLKALLDEKYKRCKKVIIVDEHTAELCLPYLLDQFQSLDGAEVIALPVGEKNKVLEVCLQVWETLTEYQIQRNDLIINLGGGVVTDMGGFIASVYKRGIDFINIPTTLLAMVDASVGGKTGVNLDVHKNQLGVFSQPVLTICDPLFLQTLNKKELISGQAEMLKHGLIADKPLFHKLKGLKQLIPDEETIGQAIQVKSVFVEADYKEQGDRKKLNFGHTIGHALEGYLLEQEAVVTHGECVAWGMVVESFLSVKNAGLQMHEFNEIESVIRGKYSSISIDETAFESLIELMHHDKKNQGKGINFTLLTTIGNATIDNYIEDEEVLMALHKIFL